MRGVWSLNHALQRASLRMEERLGITAQQRLVLRFVGLMPGVTPGELAKLLYVDRGSVTAVVKRLEARKLIRRTKHAEDGRSVVLSLTERGRRLATPLTLSIEHAARTALRASTPADVAAFHRVVRKIAAALEQACDAADD